MIGKTKNIFDTLTETEKQDIHQTARELESLLSIWASCYSVIRAKRSAPVAVLIATVLPGLPMARKLLVGKLILLIFAIDDIADERLLSYEDFLQASRAWEEIARYGNYLPESHTDYEIGVIVSEIRNEMFHCPLFQALKDSWAQQIQMLCRAMAEEYQVGQRYKAIGAEAIPRFDEYIESGLYSVGFPFWGTSVLILFSDPATLDQFARLDEVMRLTGAAIRLYNDIRTYEKEVQEANVNAVTIFLNALREQQPNQPPQVLFPQAQGSVLTQARNYAEEACARVSHVHTNTGQFEEMIRRIIAFHAYFYGSQEHNHDYHTISSGSSYAMIENKTSIETEEETVQPTPGRS